MVDTAAEPTAKSALTGMGKLVWMDGRLMEESQAVVPVVDAAFIGQTTVFEGVRGYWNADERRMYLFRVDLHLERFEESMKIMRIQPQFGPAELKQAIVDVVEANKPADDSYIRPLAWLDAGDHPDSRPGHYVPQPSHMAISIRCPYPSKLFKNALQHVCVSSWTRLSDNAMPVRLKAQANYHNSRQAIVEALIDGYDYAIFLNQQGKVAEGPGACVFLVRRGVVITPPVTAGILESVTRFSVIQLLQEELGMQVVEREIDRTELYVASEAFYCGTGLEILPIASIDRYQLGDGGMGPITARLERLYHDIVRGSDQRYAEWRTPVAPIPA